MVVGIEPVAQQIGRGLRDQETYLRARRAAEGAAQQIGDEARGALCGLERDVTRKAVAHDHVDLAARQPVALDEAGEIERQIIRIAQHRSEEHTSELQSLMRISYAVFCLKKKTTTHTKHT